MDSLLMYTGERQQTKTHSPRWVNHLTGWWVPVLHDKRQIHLNWQLLRWQKLVWVCMFVFLVILLKSTQVNVKRNAEATWSIHSKHSRVGAVVRVQEKVTFLPARQQMKWNECLLCLHTWCSAFWGLLGHSDCADGAAVANVCWYVVCCFIQWYWGKQQLCKKWTLYHLFSVMTARCYWWSLSVDFKVHAATRWWRRPRQILPP